MPVRHSRHRHGAPASNIEDEQISSSPQGAEREYGSLAKLTGNGGSLTSSTIDIKTGERMAGPDALVGFVERPQCLAKADDRRKCERAAVFDLSNLKAAVPESPTKLPFPGAYRVGPLRSNDRSCVTSRTRCACSVRVRLAAIISPFAIRAATRWRLASTALDALTRSSGYFARAIEISCATRFCARRSSESRAFCALLWLRNRSARALR